jgi:hypothetical protein
MKHQKNLRERYIQLVESFITAIENGKSGSEVEDIRNEIRNISAQIDGKSPVENSTQMLEFMPLKDRSDETKAD